MNSQSAAAVAVEAEIVDLQPENTRNTGAFNMLGLPRISDNEHFDRARASGMPHSYIAVRAGRMGYDGKDGIGFFNAAELHARVMCERDYDLNEADIAFARSKSPSFQAGVERLARTEAQLHSLFEHIMPQSFALPRGPKFEI